MIIEELGLSLASFLVKSEPLRDLAAFRVTDGAPNLDSMETPFAESIVNECFASSGHDTLALILLGEPVAYFDTSIQPIDFMESHCSDHGVFVVNSRRETVIIRKLIECGTNEE